MKYLKLYENFKRKITRDKQIISRTIDLGEFYLNYDNYIDNIDNIHNELTKGENIFVNIPPVIDTIKEMLIGNKIEFQDNVMREMTSCIPNEVNLITKTTFGKATIGCDFLAIYCNEDKNVRTFTLEYNNNMKIWDEETKIEKIIRISKEAEKYNL